MKMRQCSQTCAWNGLVEVHLVCFQVFREAPVRFGYGLGMERFKRFRFSVPAVPLQKRFVPCPSFPCFFFWKRQGKPPKKQGFFIPTEPLKIPGKEGKNARKNKEFLAGEKNKEFQKTRKGRTGRFFFVSVQSNRKGRFGSGFGSWKTVRRFRFRFRFLENSSAVPVPLSVSGKTVPTVPVSGSGSVPEPPWLRSLASRKRCDLKTRKRYDFCSAPQKVAAIFLRFLRRFSGDFSAISAVKPAILHFAIWKRSDSSAIAIFWDACPYWVFCSSILCAGAWGDISARRPHRCSWRLTLTLSWQFSRKGSTLWVKTIT